MSAVWRISVMRGIEMLNHRPDETRGSPQAFAYAENLAGSGLRPS
jgi:hypothetical protein